MHARRSFAANALALVAFVTACGTASNPGPASTSPASPEAEEAPAPSVATSLTADPLAASAPSPGAGDHADQPAATEYVCPMHPDVRQSTPGRCPRCGMTLVPVTSGAGSDAGSASAPSPAEHAH